MSLPDVIILYLCITQGSLAVGVVPDYVWPLSNLTAVKEVMKEHDASMPESGQCFEFVGGNPGLPYLSLRLNGQPESYIDISLDGTMAFKDMTISFHLYPENTADSTLVHYLYDTGNIIRLSIMENILFVSFWDEYGVSVGATAFPNLIVPNQWNHLVISRDFATGTIAVYHNGALVEELDDDFPNNIQLPTSGHLRLGRSLDKTEDGFVGRLTCFQLFGSIPTAADVSNIDSYCKPSTWSIVPQLKYKEKIVQGVKKKCLTNATDSTENGPSCEELIELGCLANSFYWNQIMTANNWTDSGRDVGYFSRASTGFIPANSDGHLLGNVVTTDRKVCSRLCMRVNGCQSYAFSQVGGKKCLMYDDVLNASEEMEGARYFTTK